MAAPTVYSSTDTDAPVLKGITGLMATSIIRAACVTGYGTKAPAGFEEYFTGTADTLIMRSPSSVAGNRPFFKIVDINIAISGGTMACRFSIQSFDTMSSATEGTGATPLSYLEYSFYFVPNAVAIPWDIIATSSSIHMFFDRVVGVSSWAFIGAGIPIHSQDGFFSGHFGLNINTPTATIGNCYPRPHNPSVATGYLVSSRRSTGDAGTIGTKLTIQDTGILVDLLGTDDASLQTMYNYPYDGKLLYARPIINDGVARSMRGFLPGFYFPQHKAGLTPKQVYTEGTLQLKAYKTNYGYCLIDIGEGFSL